MNQGSALICASCSSTITADDLALGLAVRVDGRSVCANCVDLLPGKAQFEINKLRALKGLHATTYRVPAPAHPGLQRFTFTSANNVLIHYRTVKSTGEFLAPIMPGLPPPPGPVPVVALQVPAAQRGPARSRWLLPLAGLGVLALGVVAVLVTPRRAQVPQLASRAPPTRDSYPGDPYAAYLAASADPACPGELLEQLRTQLRSEDTDGLGQAENALERKALNTASELLSQVHVPEDAAFSDLRSKRRALLLALDELRKPPAPAPEPAMPPGPGQDDLASDSHTSPTSRTAAPSGSGPGPDPSPDPGHAVPGGGDTPAASTVVAITPPAVTPATPPAPPAPATPSNPCWIIPITDLLHGGGNDDGDWTDTGFLRSQAGHLVRRLPSIPGGTYQLWINAACSHAEGSVSVLLDGVSLGSLKGSDCHQMFWHPVSLTLALPEGSHELTLVAEGLSWRIQGLYLAGSNQPEPRLAQASAVAWPRTGGQDAGHGVPALWNRDVVFPHPSREVPLDGSIDIASPWPAGAGPFLLAEPFGADGPYTISLGLERAAVERGGVALILHRGSAGRVRLAVRLEWELPAQTQQLNDGRLHQVPGAATLPLPPLLLADTDHWQTVTIPFPVLGQTPDRLRLVLQDLPDAPQDHRGFLIGTAVTVAGRPPGATDLPLLPSPLRAGDVVLDGIARGQLTTLLDEITKRHRLYRKWFDRHGFNAAHLRLLLPDATAAQIAAYGRALAGIRTLEVGRQSLVLPMRLTESWVGTAQIKSPTPLLDPSEVSIVLIATNGHELGTALADPDAMSSWLLATIVPLLSDAKRGGFLPVLVIGALDGPLDEAQRATLNRAWAHVNDVLGEVCDVPLPVIDVRQAQSCQDVAGSAQALLVEGVRTLVYQIDWAQRSFLNQP